MTRVNKGARSRPSYVCSKAKAGADCSYHSLPCAIVEHALRHHLPERLRDLEGAADDGDLVPMLQGAEELVDTLKERAADIADTLMRLRDLEGSGSRTLARNLKETETDLEIAEEALRSLQERQRTATGATVSARVERALEALEAPEDTHSPGEVSLALRKVFDRAVFRGSDDGGKWRWSAIEFEWKHGGECVLPLGNFGPYKDDGKATDD